jgi:hypothetical protein
MKLPATKEVRQEVDALSRLVGSMLDDLRGAALDARVPARADRFEGSLFERCLDLCRLARETVDDEAVRLLQHLSCTGGTLFAKCLASMPNVLLLNEIDPLSRPEPGQRTMFRPTDVISLIHAGDPATSDALVGEVFRGEMLTLRQQLAREGRRLVLRVHSHGQFLTKEDPSRRPTVRALLDGSHATLGAVTVRDPVDSYLSMLSNGWIDYEPATFDEYCRRYAMFLDAHPGCPVFRYEDLVDEPQATMQALCATLKLPYSEQFVETFDLFELSGDSGRRGGPIGRRPRRDHPAAFRREAEEAPQYELLCKRLGYLPLWIDG